MSSCCSILEAAAHPCPKCGEVGPIVGVAPVRPHLPDADDGDWQHCENLTCDVVFHLDSDAIETDSVRTQIGRKAIDKATPVCFCFAHTADSLGEDFASNDGVSAIEASIKVAVADSQCACEHLNPNGKCCLVDVRRTLRSLARPPSLS